MAKQGEHGISWCDVTWNPMRGSSRLTDGHRQRTGTIQFVQDHIADPLKWKEPRRVFVSSMWDLFHESLPDAHIDAIFAIMALAPHHTFQILTKRPVRMLHYMMDYRKDRDTSVTPGIVRDLVYRWDRYHPQITLPKGTLHEHRLDSWLWPLRNVWLGVNVENQKTADERIPPLMETPAAIRWISAVPLLGPIQLTNNHSYCPEHDFSGGFCVGPCPSRRYPNWAVVGGESGPGARPMHPDWVRSLRDDCQHAGAAFHFTQWGDWLPGQNDPHPQQDWRLAHWQAGRLLDGRTWDEFPETSA